MASGHNGAPSGFFVVATGQVDGCKLHGADNLYCKYSFNYGLDWKVIQGLEHGISQIGRKSPGMEEPVVTWNYPIDATFRTTNVHGWPQIVVSVYGLNLFGQDIIRGYGWVHLPTTNGRHVRYIRLYAPVSSSMCRRFQSWLVGNPPELFDPRFVAGTRGREVTRVRSNGTVKVIFNITTKSMASWGYEARGERSNILEMKHVPDQPVTTTSASGSHAGGGGTRFGDQSSVPLQPYSDTDGSSSAASHGGAPAPAPSASFASSFAAGIASPVAPRSSLTAASGHGGAATGIGSASLSAISQRDDGDRKRAPLGMSATFGSSSATAAPTPSLAGLASMSMRPSSDTQSASSTTGYPRGGNDASSMGLGGMPPISQPAVLAMPSRTSSGHDLLGARDRGGSTEDMNAPLLTTGRSSPSMAPPSAPPGGWSTAPPGPAPSSSPSNTAAAPSSAPVNMLSSSLISPSALGPNDPPASFPVHVAQSQSGLPPRSVAAKKKKKPLTGVTRPTIDPTAATYGGPGTGTSPLLPSGSSSDMGGARTPVGSRPALAPLSRAPKLEPVRR